MKRYTKKDSMIRAMAEHLDALMDCPVRPGRRNFKGRLSVGSIIVGMEWQTSDVTGLALLNFKISSSPILIATPADLPKEGLIDWVGISEGLSTFQAAYREDGKWYEFHGFGAGLSEEFHRRVCELANVEGFYIGTGTMMNIDDILCVAVPHPFFRERGLGIQSSSIEQFHKSMEDRWRHVDRLRKAMAVVELLERSVEGLD